jgi:hypothetical protein
MSSSTDLPSEAPDVLPLSAPAGTTAELSGRLTSALLGHLLFLKGQIPLSAPSTPQNYFTH